MGSRFTLKPIIHLQPFNHAMDIRECVLLYLILSALQKLVSHQESQEHSLYASARSAEADRKKQSQVVDQLQEKLEALKQKNANKLKVGLYSCDKSFNKK